MSRDVRGATRRSNRARNEGSQREQGGRCCTSLIADSRAGICQDLDTFTVVAPTTTEYVTFGTDGPRRAGQHVRNASGTGTQTSRRFCSGIHASSPQGEKPGLRVRCARGRVDPPCGSASRYRASLRLCDRHVWYLPGHLHRGPRLEQLARGAGYRSREAWPERYPDVPMYRARGHGRRDQRDRLQSGSRRLLAVLSRGPYRRCAPARDRHDRIHA